MTKNKTYIVGAANPVAKIASIRFENRYYSDNTIETTEC